MSPPFNQTGCSPVLFDSPDLLAVQRFAFHRFLEEGIVAELAKKFPIKISTSESSIELLLNSHTYKLLAPADTPRECILRMKTYSSKVYAQAEIVVKDHAGQLISRSRPEWVLLCQLPLMTERGHFIVNGAPRVIVHQFVRSPGIYFHEILKKERKNINLHSKRFYGDLIPLKGVWIRFEISKKGRIDIRFKKGKKVRAHLLERCLQQMEEQLAGKKAILFTRTYNSSRVPIDLARKDHTNLTAKKRSFVSFRKRGFLGSETSMLENQESESDPCMCYTNSVCKKSFRLLSRNWGFNRQILAKSHMRYKQGLYTLQKSRIVRAMVSQQKQASTHKEGLFLAEGESIYSFQKVGRRLKEIPLSSCFTRTYNMLYSYNSEDAKDESFSFKEERGKVQRDASPRGKMRRLFRNVPGCCTARAFIPLATPICSHAQLKRNNAFKHSNNLLLAKDYITFSQSLASSVLKTNRKVYSEVKQKGEECSENLFSCFKMASRYDLGELGRAKLNHRFDLFTKDQQLTSLDVASAAVWLSRLRRGEEIVDDIDHFKTRRVRSCGELLQTQFENGLIRLRKLLSSKLKEWRAQAAIQTPQNASIRRVGARFLVTRNKQTLKWGMGLCNGLVWSRDGWGMGNGASLLGLGQSPIAKPHWSRIPQRSPIPHSPTKSNHRSLISQSKAKQSKAVLLTNKDTKLRVRHMFTAKVITGALREFFGSNPLSQYMDQTNPLAEMTHKRRISSLGIGGVSRASAGMAIRGIHPTHYGRICPIETPEGKNAGLVNSLAFWTKMDRNGFLKTGYYQVIKGQLQSELGFSFYSAEKESLAALHIAPSDLQQSWTGLFRTKQAAFDAVPVRIADNLVDVFKTSRIDTVQSVGISPIQNISVATSLIPFLEHNDANRALMGSNMQRQAVPLMFSERAIVGTGLESLVLTESGQATQSRMSGFVSYVSAVKVIVERLSPAKQLKLFHSGKRNTTITSQASFVQLDPFTSLKQDTSDFYTERNLLMASLIQTPFVMPALSFLRETDMALKRIASKRKSQEDASNQGDSVVRIPYKTAVSKRARVLQTERTGKLSRLFFKRNVFHLKRIRAISQKKQSCLQKPHSLQINYRTRDAMCMLWNVRSRLTAVHKQLSLMQTASYKQSIRWLGNAVPMGLCDGALRWGEAPNQTKQRSPIPHSPTKSNQRAPKSNQSKSALFPKQKSCTKCAHSFNSFQRSNQSTCILEKALVQESDWVQKGDLLSDCSASQSGTLAVGKNVVIAYIPWDGYNFEDAIVISSRLVKQHVYSSVHIERYVFQAQDFQEENEFFTNQIPGIPLHRIAHLEESGLPKIGCFLKQGELLVGKVQYSNRKTETTYERLLRDILGTNDPDLFAKNKSFYVPKGVEARCINHKVMHCFQKPIFESGERKQLLRPKGAAKTVHVFLAEKRAIQVGDKMSGRHGNKGVISCVLPAQDMPYLPDGTAVDVIVNPLGVPSRMNVGQVLECLLGLACSYSQQSFKTTSFDERYGLEASKSLVYLKLYQARLQTGQNWLFQADFPGKTLLVDGRSGECFDQWMTVGKAYMLKLIHMVCEKIHARMTGPYALITQQPLRGRSNKGGQRLGEMEVWALEGFGAAYTLQELLTKKSDDFNNRKSIPREILPETQINLNNTSIDSLRSSSRIVSEKKEVLGQSEIFKVLLCELKALCLDVGVYVSKAESFSRTPLKS